ncbi:hypothetical protein DFV88_24765 [Salmonella enterica subsp. enterica serovar Newport]|nr:hypothetical protein [Salmonella enterica subsp. enterica serovar Newport]
MKRYHVISISVLIGLIVGLSVSKAAEAAPVSYKDTGRAVCVIHWPNGESAVETYDNGELTQSTYPGETFRNDKPGMTAKEWAFIESSNLNDNGHIADCKVIREASPQ